MLSAYVREIANHIRDDITLRIAHFVEQLLCDRADGNKAARAWGFGDDEARPSALHSPIGMPMPAQSGTSRQSVNVPPVTWAEHSSRCPASVPAASLSKSSGPQPNSWISAPSAIGAIYGASGNDDVGAGSERGRDRKRAGICDETVDAIGALDLLKHRRTVEHVACVAIDNLCELAGQVVAFDHADAQAQSHRCRAAPQRFGAACRIKPACVGDDANAPVEQSAQMRQDVAIDEVGRETWR